MAVTTRPARAHAGAVMLTRTIGDYVALTKPRIVELLLVTTVPTMLLAERGLPSAALVGFTLLGGTLAAASANVLNCYLDRDIDAVMKRTRRRPIHRGAVSPNHALVFGVLLGLAAATVFLLTTNALSAALAVGAIAFYVGIYTAVLKRRTSANIVWGGAAGCMPVLIGWAAVRDDITWTPLVLFMVIFLWTPPHFWALAMRYRDDYAAAGVPMLPVVATDAQVSDRIVAYSWAMVLVSLSLWPIAHTTLLYPIAASLLGVLFLAKAQALRVQAHHAGPTPSMALFHWSITYLSALFVVIGGDAMLEGLRR